MDVSKVIDKRIDYWKKKLVDNINYKLLLFSAVILALVVSCSMDLNKRSISSDYSSKSSNALVPIPNKVYQQRLSVNSTANSNCANLIIESPSKTNGNNQHQGLLSPRIYSGILQPKSLLINNFEPLKADINQFLIENNVNASVYVENLRNGANMGIRQNSRYFPASLNKLPVAVLIMQNVEDGKLSLNTSLPIQDYEHSSASGNLYLNNVTNLSVKELLEIMLKDSDNTAFNVLFDNIDKKELSQLLNYYNIDINLEYPDRRVEFINHTDRVTPISLYNFFSSLYLSTVLLPNDSEYILSLLSNTDFNIHQLADLPYNITIAQKYGEYYIDNTKLFHDCGIMYIETSRIFYCIMIKDQEVGDAKNVMGHIVNSIYTYVRDERQKLNDYGLNHP